MDPRRLLEIPSLYEFLQRLTGLEAARRRFVSDFVHPFPGAALLDIGCGPGSLLAYLPETVAYTGYDANPRYIAYAQQRYAQRGAFYCAAVGDERQAAASFDFVVALGVLHHLDDATAQDLIAEAWRLLRPGAVLVSLDPVLTPSQSWAARRVVSADRGAYVRDTEAYLALCEQHFPTPDYTLTNLLRIPSTQLIMRARKPAPGSC